MRAQLLQHARVCEVTPAQHRIVHENQLRPALPWVRVMQPDMRLRHAPAPASPGAHAAFESLSALAGALHAVRLQEPRKLRAPAVVSAAYTGRVAPGYAPVEHSACTHVRFGF